MKTISFINLKGGVGKTASAVNFAYLLSMHNKKVLLVDNDKQGSTTRFFRRYGYTKPSIAEIMLLRIRDASEVICRTDYENLDLLPANRNLFIANTELQKDEENNQLDRLKNALEPVQNQYDYCVIDNAPDINIGIWNALMTSNEYIIPVKLDQAALDGIGDFLDSLADMDITAQGNNPGLTFRGCLATMMMRCNVDRDGKEQLQEMYPTFKTSIRYTAKVKESTFLHKPLELYAPKCTAAQDYRAFTEEYMEKEPRG